MKLRNVGRAMRQCCRPLGLWFSLVFSVAVGELVSVGVDVGIG